MSNTPGISPITPDIEDIRHSGDDAYDDENLRPENTDPEESDESASSGSSGGDTEKS